SGAELLILVSNSQSVFYRASKVALRLLRRGLLALLIGYWLIFLLYTVERFVTGGSSAIAAWYMHISLRIVPRGDGWILEQWSWGKFLARQFVLFGITLVLCLVERQSRRAPSN